MVYYEIPVANNSFPECRYFQYARFKKLTSFILNDFSTKW